MAAKAFNLSELETICRVIVAGNRSDRLRAMNIFRAANSKDPVEYLVNADTVSREDFDGAFDAFASDVSNAASGSVSGDTDELEVIFNYLLVSGRVDRLKVLNAIREELDLDPVEYLVNMHIPDSGTRDAAYLGVEEDADA